ncbi:hypothetical protein [Altererythrobacter aquiaggeris]|uniref:hypothetical protein n=1 Tax=Aestuarierythrobacter aquiaggeris TaxID=1898396 RepID=UPI00301A3760
MNNASSGLLGEFTAKYKDALIVTGVVIAALTSSGNLALNADIPTERNNTAIRNSLADIEQRLSAIEFNVDGLAKWQLAKDEEMEGRRYFMSCAVQQIQENRRAANAERACDLQVPR